MTTINIIIFIFLIISSVIIYSGKIISAFQNWGIILNTKNKKLEKEINLLQLKHFRNNRFRFSFEAPKIWDRKDPMNLDGYTFVNPQNKNVNIYAWGSYFTKEFLTENSDSFFDKKIKIVENTYSGLSALEYINSADDLKIVKEDIEGERKVIEFRKNKIKIKAVLFSTEYDDKHITVQCEAPKRIFMLYENLFYKIGKSLEVLKINV